MPRERKPQQVTTHTNTDFVRKLNFLNKNFFIKTLK